MKTEGIIRQFGFYTEEQAMALKEELGLTMPPETLAFCMKYYRDGARRDPYADELLMLDRLSAALENEIDSISPTDLYTNDGFAAETYADLMEKRRTIDPHSPHPCTLNEALKMASIHLFAAGRNAIPYRGTAFIPEYIQDYPMGASQNCISAPDAPYRLRILPEMGGRDRIGDLLVLLSPGYGQTQLQFETVCEVLLSDPEMLSPIHSVTNVHPTGILRTLLEIANGLSIVLSPFSKTESTVPMTVLTDSYEGCRILRIDSAAEEWLLPAIRHMGLTASAFAKVTPNVGYTFCRNDGVAVAIDPRFLRALFHYKGIKLILPEESDHSAISHRTVTPLNCRYILPTESTAAGESSIINGTLCATAASSLTASPMRSALYTAILPIITLCVHGVPLEAQSMSIGLELPQSISETLISAQSLSAILGLYRAQIELAIPAQATAVRISESATVPSVTVFGTAKALNPIPGKLTKSESKLYCLTPDIKEDGTPDFRALRNFMTAVTSLSQNGMILSACVLANESIATGLSKMSGEYVISSCEELSANKNELPLAILIESDFELSYPKIDVTIVSADAIAEDMPILTRKESIIWSEAPEIVLLANETDADARALSAILSARGCHVHLYAPESDPDPLSRALLGAQTLILCRDVTLPNDKRIRFAYTVMKNAGGLLLSLNPQNSTEKDFIFFSDGLNEHILDLISQKKEKKTKKY